MATTATAAVNTQQVTYASTADAPAEVPIIFTPQLRGAFQVVVIGAGGTGARVIPPLTQMLRRNDRVAIIDGDIVEDRNLFRQHFTSRDIGLPKAVVLAERYQRSGVHITAYHAALSDTNIRETATELLVEGQRRQRPVGIIIIGCVDNAAARRAILGLTYHLTAACELPTAWIDVGNETRGGQVVLTLRRWSGRLKAWTSSCPTTLSGIETALPQLLRDAPEGADQPACRERIDLQTVQINLLAASSALNVMSWLTLGLPITSCGAFFSTLNTMQPIRLVGISGYSLLPETTYAIRGNDEQATG